MRTRKGGTVQEGWIQKQQNQKVTNAHVKYRVLVDALPALENKDKALLSATTSA